MPPWSGGGGGRAMPFVWGGAATNGASSGAADAEIAALFTSGGTTRNATAACPSKSLPGKPPKSKRRKVELEAADANLDWMGAAFGKGAGVQETDNHTTIDPLKVGNHEVKVFGLDPKTKKSHVRAAFTEFGDIRGVRLVVSRTQRCLGLAQQTHLFDVGREPQGRTTSRRL